MGIITTTDLASYLEDDAAMSGRGEFLVDLANGLVSDLAPSLSAPAPAKVRSITLEVAARAWRNPAGYSSETVDDYTYRLPTEARRAGVYVTDTEAAEIAELSGTGSKVYQAWLA